MKTFYFLFLTLFFSMIACKPKEQENPEGDLLVQTQRNGNLYGEYTYNDDGTLSQITYHTDHQDLLIYNLYYTAGKLTNIQEYFGTLTNNVHINWNGDFPSTISIDSQGNTIDITVGNDNTHITYFIIADGTRIRRYNFIWSGDDISTINLYYKNGNNWVFMRKYEFQYDDKKHSPSEVLIGTNGQYDDPLLWVHLFSKHNVTRAAVSDNTGNSIGTFVFNYTYTGNDLIETMSGPSLIYEYSFIYE